VVFGKPQFQQVGKPTEIKIDQVKASYRLW